MIFHSVVLILLVFGKHLTTGERISPTDSCEGPGGVRFDDQYIANSGQITAIKMSSGAHIDSIRMRYGTNWGPRNGGHTGVETYKELKEGEKIIKVVARCGGYVNALLFVGDKGSLLHSYLGVNSQDSTFEHEGCHLRYISGKGGAFV